MRMVRPILMAGRPLIPSLHRHIQSSSGSSTGRLPTPPPRSARSRTASADSMHISPVPGAHPHRQASRQPAYQASHQPRQITPQRPAPSRQPTGLSSEIGNLLGNKPKHPTQSQTRPAIHPQQQAQAQAPLRKASNDCQASWLAHPSDMSIPQIPQSVRAESVYLPVTKPKDRPMIPPGKLAPAPPPKVKVKAGARGLGSGDDGAFEGGTGLEVGRGGRGGGGSGSAGGGIASAGGGAGGGTGGTGGGGKWADRLRSRK